MSTSNTDMPVAGKIESSEAEWSEVEKMGPSNQRLLEIAQNSGHRKNGTMSQSKSNRALEIDPCRQNSSEVQSSSQSLMTITVKSASISASF